MRAKHFPPTLEVFVIGYPFGEFGPGQTALWTRGTVASEYGTPDAPFLLIDARSRQGQSGAPVVKFDLHGNLSPFGGIVSGVGPAYVLGGLYSGRINPQSDIGTVWKSETLIEILDHAAMRLA